MSNIHYNDKRICDSCHYAKNIAIFSKY